MILMNSLVQPLKLSDEELEMYAQQYINRRITENEGIIFDHYIRREQMLEQRKHQLPIKMYA